jgi:hypothetical protein
MNQVTGGIADCGLRIADCIAAKERKDRKRKALFLCVLCVLLRLRIMADCGFRGVLNVALLATFSVVDIGKGGMTETKLRWAGLNPSRCGWQRAIREQNRHPINPPFAGFTPRWKGTQP